MSYFDGIIYFNNNVPFLGNKILNVFQNLMLKLEILLQENWAVHQIANIVCIFNQISEEIQISLHSSLDQQWVNICIEGCALIQTE